MKNAFFMSSVGIYYTLLTLQIDSNPLRELLALNWQMMENVSWIADPGIRATHGFSSQGSDLLALQRTSLSIL